MTPSIAAANMQRSRESIAASAERIAKELGIEVVIEFSRHMDPLVRGVRDLDALDSALAKIADAVAPKLIDDPQATMKAPKPKGEKQ